MQSCWPTRTCATAGKQQPMLLQRKTFLSKVLPWPTLALQAAQELAAVPHPGAHPRLPQLPAAVASLSRSLHRSLPMLMMSCRT